MEFLDKLGDWFNAFLAGAERFITGLFGSSNERRIRQIGFKRDKQGNTVVVPGSVLDRINSLESKYEQFSEEELKQCASVFRARLAEGETLDDLLPDAFAAVREAGKRVLKMRHYDVQMVGGYILHNGMIAEMVTGEGKTLVATLPTYLNGLAGHVHVITVNDYLALRDMEWMGPLYMSLGLTVGAIQSNMSPQERQKHYACDITYGTNNEFGFDYLRDNMKPTKALQVQGPLDFAVVDEIDNILIDEARTPLIISGPAHDDTTKYAKADKISRQLEQGAHFEVKEKEHTCHMTEAGVRKAEELAGVESFYTAGNMEWPHLIDNSLKAYHLYKRDVHYVVENGGVVIVDEFTGRKMEGRQWSDGLHQAVEAKEGVTIKNETQTLATITLQNYFKLYNKLAGMTGTAMTEAEEFWKIYKLDVISVPTNRPMKRINYPDVIYRSEKEKWDAVVGEIREVHDTGRPILVGTVSIEKSELLGGKLKKYGIDHKVLNAKNHEREAEFVAQAGRKGAVTIATNMAGRGTDIILGGNPEHMAWEDLQKEFDSRLDVPKTVWDERTDAIAEREGMKKEGREVAEVGGLHVIGTERHDSRRIDLQLRGRSGRQGDPGSSRFLLSLEDDLMRIFAGEWVKNMLTRLGMKDGEAIESGMVTRRIEAAQKKVEERHFDTRKHLLEYDEVMDEQRKNVYSYRQQILDGFDCRSLIIEMIDQQVEDGTRNILRDDYRWETVIAWVGQAFHVEIDATQLRGMDLEQVKTYLLDEAQRQTEDNITEQMETDLPTDVEDEREWNWQAMSRWANAQFDLNTNDRELKKIGRDNLFHYLNERADQSRSRWDFSDLETLMAEDFQRRSLSGWLYNQFMLEIDPKSFEELDTNAAIELIQERVRKAYDEKEINFPVAVGVHRFLQDNSLSDRQRKEQLVKWASHRFNSQLSSEELSSRTPNDIVNLLTECSRNYNKYDPETVSERIEDQLNKVYQNGNGHEPNGQNGFELRAEKEALQQLANWTNDEFRAELKVEDFDALSQEDARLKLLSEIQSIYRPELRQAEQSLILDVLDTAWKDHLYYMDHLRQGIGLMGYAQKDPKVEYKREGRRAFQQMWERIAQQVTGAIFRIDQESPEFMGSLWQITATVHEDAPAAGEDPAQQLEPGQTEKAVEPIRNAAPKVGRNDPCPCGSGKKYKKCCGRGM